MVPPGAFSPFRPTPLVRLPWGSTSIRSTRRPDTAIEVATLMAVVVFPTPPFWLATATTRACRSPSLSVIWPIYGEAYESVMNVGRNEAPVKMFHVEHLCSRSQVERFCLHSLLRQNYKMASFSERN